MSVCMNVKEFVDCVHGVCEWMEGHNENKLYIVTCNCIIYCEKDVIIIIIIIIIIIKTTFPLFAGFKGHWCSSHAFVAHLVSSVYYVFSAILAFIWCYKNDKWSSCGKLVYFVSVNVDVLSD